jgi:hypothetical protein
MVRIRVDLEGLTLLETCWRIQKRSWLRGTKAGATGRLGQSKELPSYEPLRLIDNSMPLTKKDVMTLRDLNNEVNSGQ